MDTVIDCKYYPECTGCQWIGKPYGWQQNQKLKQLHDSFASNNIELPEKVTFKPTKNSQVRDRADLTILRDEDGSVKIGFYNKQKNLIDIQECKIFSPKLQSWFEWVKENPPPIVKKGSFRIRVGVYERPGIWLDFSNHDIKNLMDEKNWLLKLVEHAVVEIGQRQKMLVVQNGELKLEKKSTPHKWFQTYSYPKYENVDLYSLVSSFTQPGIEANKTLVQAVCESLDGYNLKNTLELFSGIGNLTIPLVSMGSFVSCYEVDKNAIRAFEETLKNLPYKNQIKLHQKNLYSKSIDINWKYFDLLVVDPPRSGLKNFVERINVNNKPKHILYVSCFLESLMTDIVALKKMGFSVESIVGVDQFPQSAHCEWVVLLRE